MKESKVDPMLSDLALEQGPRASDSEPTLSVLAEHLSAIADALRKSGQPEGGGPKSSQYSSQRPPSKPSIPATSPVRSIASSALSGAPDIKLRRAVYGDLARQVYATRRRRTSVFGNSELFGEPAWDILLDLYIAHVDNKPVSVSSACIGSAAPPTTGLRWLGVLAEHGFVLREHDPEDQRRVLVRLTEHGLAAMDEYFASAELTA